MVRLLIQRLVGHAPGCSRAVCMRIDGLPGLSRCWIDVRPFFLVVSITFVFGDYVLDLF